MPPPPPPPAPNTGEAALSVVLCTHGRPEYLRACLAGLPGQSRREFEVLVVDSASAPAAAALVAAIAAESGARLLRTDEPGLSRARNLGLAEAGGSWIAFLDDDAVPEPGWAAALLDRIAVLPERAAAIGGRILPAWEEPLPGWWPPSLRGVLTIVEWDGFGEVGVDLPAGIDIYGANMAFAAAPLREVGGFAESLGRVGDRLLSGEEVAVVESLRARGYRAFYEGAAAVRHSIQRDRLRPGWLLSRLLWQGATDALRDRAGGNGHRRLLGAAARPLVQAPLLLWPATSSRLLRARCGAAYNLGYLRGRFAGAA
ncbi:MAG: glycosyltransferase [Acetobacteraceae bacterium]|nr:glycosyltransferase [Acetobacteraceae bacterium]